MADDTAAPDYYTRGLAVSDALEHDETLRVEMDHTGVVDIAGRDLYLEWQDLAPGEAFDVLGRVDEAGELRPIDWAALQGGPSGYRPGRVYIDIDEDTPSIPAFVHASRRWNGFAVPVFTREALIANADALRRIFPDDYMPEGERMLLTFDAAGFPSLIDEQYPDQGDFVVPVEIEGQTFYDIGGGGFTWMDAPREHEHYYDAERSD